MSAPSDRESEQANDPGPDEQEPMNPDPHTKGPKPNFSWSSNTVALAVSLPPLLLAVAEVTRLGLERDVFGLIAILLAAVLAILPTLGLRSLLPEKRWSLPAAAWIWGLSLVVCLPLYFPDDGPGRVLAEGNHPTGASNPEAAQPTAGQPDEGGAAVSPIARLSHTNNLADQRTRPSELRFETEDILALSAEEKPGPIVLNYKGDGRSLRVDAEIDGPEIGQRFSMILDTGATFSTLSKEALSNVGIAIEPDAPWVELQTAGGRIEAPLVLVDAVWLGDVRVGWITVAVCEACSSPPVMGLLGLNVLQRFRVAIDHELKHIELHRRERDFDRRLDIGHWLDVESRVSQSWDGRVEVELKGHNRAQHSIRTAVIDLDCSGEGFAIELGLIPARGETTTRVELPRGTNCKQQRLTLARAHWVEDRFDDG